MSNKVEDESKPDLDDWMSKIREKKLRPVIPNSHKSNEKITDKRGSSTAPYEANELSKMRQGLRSVSTPKWPGANDHKAKTNVNQIPSRAQLRSVSDRTIDTQKAATPTTTLPADSRSTTQITGSKTDDDPEQVDEGHFPLDAEPEEAAKQSDLSSTLDPEISASSGTTRPDAAVELKLPDTAMDDFPLDLEENTEATDADELDTVQEPKTPVTLSSGVFDTASADVELTLPKHQDMKKGDSKTIEQEPSNSELRSSETVIEQDKTNPSINDTTQNLDALEPSRGFKDTQTSGIKCSKCTKEVNVDELADHTC